MDFKHNSSENSVDLPKFDSLEQLCENGNYSFSSAAEFVVMYIF